MPSGLASISVLPMRIRSTLSLNVRAVRASIIQASQVRLRRLFTWSGLVVWSMVWSNRPLPTRSRTTSIVSSVTTRAGSKGTFAERRSLIAAASGSGRTLSSRTKRSRAIGLRSRRCGTSAAPSGNASISTRWPRWPAAIRASSRKQPKPIVIWRSKGSVWGKRLSRSQRITASLSPTSSIVQGCRLCGLGARIAWRNASSRTSGSGTSSPCHGASACLGTRVTTKTAPEPTRASPRPPAARTKRRVVDMINSCWFDALLYWFGIKLVKKLVVDHGSAAHADRSHGVTPSHAARPRPPISRDSITAADTAQRSCNLALRSIHLAESS